MKARRKRRLGTIALAIVLAPVVLVVGMAVFMPLPSELRDRGAPSLRIVSRSGKLLREVRADDGVRARPLPLAEFPPHVQNAMLAAEDRRFRAHFGVDVGALIRAAGSNLWHRRVVSGASTITMQLARTVRPHRRNLWGKLVEMSLALRIEASLSKDEILEQYLNRVIYGPNLRGYAAASQAYFGTAPASLSVAEAALVAGLPRGPSLYAKKTELARRRRDRVLARMAEAGMIDEEARARAAAEPVVVTLDRPANGAPHLVRAIALGQLGDVQRVDVSGASEIRTTIDDALQRAAESAVASTLQGLRSKHVTAASVLAIDNATGDVLAWVGSPDFFDAEHGGQNDGVLAKRQPGSSLKPFLYAEAMTRLGYTAATVLPDVELHIPLPGGGDYVPHDYDTKLRGPVRLREALGNSLNIPAVHTIHQLGTQAFLDRLRSLGFASLTEDAEHYGPALALGDGEVKLVELARAYATLARGGVERPLRVVSAVKRETETPLEAGPAARVLDERVAAVITDVLADRNARLAAFGDQNVLELPFPVAAKTGTSKGYRDNVAAGFTREVTVAVWTGNFDGSAMLDVSGIAGAGPIFRAVMEAAMANRRPEPFTMPAGLERAAVCATSGEIATSACPHRMQEWMGEGDAAHAPPCAVHVPVRIDLDTGLRAGPGCPHTETRVFERWRAPFVDWAERTGRPVVPKGSSPACPAEEPAEGPSAGGAAITYPFDGARFVIDPERPIDLQRLVVTTEPADAEVRVDGTRLPADHGWPLVAGHHVLTVLAQGKEGRPVRIDVR